MSLPELLLRPTRDRVKHVLGIQVRVTAGVKGDEAKRAVRRELETACRHLRLQGYELVRFVGAKGPYPYVEPRDTPARPTSKRYRAGQPHENREREYRARMDAVQAKPTLATCEWWEYRVWGEFHAPPVLVIREDESRVN